jgi:hypothetical protein
MLSIEIKFPHGFSLSPAQTPPISKCDFEIISLVPKMSVKYLKAMLNLKVRVLQTTE